MKKILNNLKVPVHLEFKDFKINLDKLQQLDLGDIIQTQIALNSEVSLLSGETVLAYGKLLQLNKKLVFKVTDIVD